MRIVAGILGAALLVAGTPARSQDFPNKPVRILVPYAPGGVVDIAARVVGQKLSEKWGQQVLVENRPGGNGWIAPSAAAKAPPDGYTLLMAHVGEFSVSPAVFPNVPFDFDRDFVAITMVSDTPMGIATHTAGSINSIKDLIDQAKAKPGTIGMGTPGTGSVNHLTGEWIGVAAKAKFLHVPYKGGAPAGTAVAAGEVPFGVVAISSALPHVKTGRVKMLAVTTAKRSPFYADWPTLQEAGVPEVDATNWVGLFAPKGVPQAILDKLYADVAATLEMQDVRDRFAAGGATVPKMTPAEFAAKVKQDLARYKQIAKDAGVKPE